MDRPERADRDLIADHRQARLRGRLPGAATVRWRLDPSSTSVALTFDDGPDPEGTPAVLDALESVRAKATFFLLVDAAERHPSLVTGIVERGHVVGLHADRHERLDRVRTDVLTERLRAARERLEQLAGRSVNLHRPPFGRLSYRNARAARRAGLTVVLWSHDPRDWDEHGSATLPERVHASVVPGAIVLLHDGANSYPGQARRTGTAVRGVGSVLEAGRLEAVAL